MTFYCRPKTRNTNDRRSGGDKRVSIVNPNPSVSSEGQRRKLRSPQAWGPNPFQTAVDLANLFIRNSNFEA